MSIGQKRMTRREFFATLGKSTLAVGFSLSPLPAALVATDAKARISILPNSTYSGFCIRLSIL